MGQVGKSPFSWILDQICAHLISAGVCELFLCGVVLETSSTRQDVVKVRDPLLYACTDSVFARFVRAHKMAVR